MDINNPTEVTLLPSANGLVTICCWCPTWHRNDPRNAGASHGICPACYARVFTDEAAS